MVSKPLILLRTQSYPSTHIGEHEFKQSYRHSPPTCSQLQNVGGGVVVVGGNVVVGGDVVVGGGVVVVVGGGVVVVGGGVVVQKKLQILGSG